MRPLMIEASEYDCASLLAYWRWRVPPTITPLFVSALGDWVFGAPDGSLWALSTLDGDLFQVAPDAAEYKVFPMTVYQCVMGQLHESLG